MKTNTIIHGDCIEEMQQIEENSVDAIVTDPPYGVTRNQWDEEVSDFMPNAKRLLKEDGLLITTGQEPFASKMISGNIDFFKYDLVWDKKLSSGFLNANRMPLRRHERILVFGWNQGTYNPIMRGSEKRVKGGSSTQGNGNYGEYDLLGEREFEGRYPTTIIEVTNANRKDKEHPTQKPVELMRWLIKTYSNPDDLILDPFAGSGSTLIAAKQAGRDYLGIEMKEKYCSTARKRLNEQPERIDTFI